MPHYHYCQRCRRLIGKGVNKRYRAAALKAAWSKEQDGFLCFYTGVKLDESDTSSPWYITYDHFIPRKKGNLVVCAYFINDMKSDLSADEFRAIVMEYDRHRKGAPFNRDIVKFQYWTRKAKPDPAPVPPARSSRMVNVPECVICGGVPVRHSYYCARCRKFWLNFPGRVEAMKRAWSKKDNGFIDYYIGIKLEEEDYDSPYFMVFDHLIPRKKGDLAATSMLFNALKTDLSEEEFYLVMNELASHFEGAQFNRNVVKFEYWKRWRRKRSG